jgi:hypothetical protein
MLVNALAYSRRGPITAPKRLCNADNRSIHDGQWVGLEDGGHRRVELPETDDIERPGKFRLILYPQPEHKSEETKWTKKAL